MADNSPIVIRKIIEEDGHGHHGGAWKVAYADFVTAMMAFFLMLWLLSTADEQQLKGLAEYFSDAAENKSQPGGMGGVLDGVSFVTPDMAVQAPVSPFAPSSLPLTATPEENDPDEFALDLALAFGFDEAADAAGQGPLDDQGFAQEQQRREQAAFDEARAEMLNALSQRPDLAKFTDSLIDRRHARRLRIQIVDREQNAMFPTASAEMLDNARPSSASSPRPSGISRTGSDPRPHRCPPFASGPIRQPAPVVGPGERHPRGAGGSGPAGIADRRRHRQGPVRAAFPDDLADARNRRISLVLLRDATAPAAGAQGGG
ncbi:MAG: flagellar motor protein MotB [Geminicoccaceae bacterium]